MKLVVDTSVLFSFFKKESSTRELVTSFGIVELSAPSFCKDELINHEESICETAVLSKNEFKEVLDDMLLFVKLFPLREYAKWFEEAINLSVDPDDIDFFALALKLDRPIWSNDPHFRLQSEVRVYTTEELVKLLSGNLSGNK